MSVGGGKGGVGKTFVTTNLAVALARAGHRVVAVDADLEGANLHTCLGAGAPPLSLADFVAGREEDLGKILIDTSIPNLRIVAGTHGNLDVPQPGEARRSQLLRALRRLEAEFVLIDLPSGAQPFALDCFLVADAGLVVLAPDPTSVENVYTFLRAAFYRRLRLAASNPRVQEVVTHAMDPRNELGIRTPLDLRREATRIDPEDAERLALAATRFCPRLIVNDVRSADDVRLGFAVRSVCRKHFGIDSEYLGYVNHDPAVRRATGARRPVLEFRWDSDASVYLLRIARKLIQARDALRAERS